MLYNTGVLVGRAFALANAHARRDPHREPVAELCALASGDRTALVLAQARYREFLAGPSPTVEDARALALLEDALARFDMMRTAHPVA